MADESRAGRAPIAFVGVERRPDPTNGEMSFCVGAEHVPPPLSAKNTSYTDPAHYSFFFTLNRHRLDHAIRP